MLWSLIGLGFANQIINGELETDFPATVALGAQLGESGFSACTGTLITPLIVLSAAHCGGDLPPDLILQVGKAFFGTSVQDTEAVIGFEDFVIHPDYVELDSSVGGTRGSNDFGLLVLSEPAPVQPIFFNSEEMTEEWIGEEIISVGFGITGADQNDSGTKRSAFLTVSALEEMFVIANNADNENSANICSGDSGGSQMYFDTEIDQWVQIAVHSWGDQYCTTYSGSTRTDLVSDWIFETIEAVHGSTDLCEVNGYYDDDECTEFSICQGVDPACLLDEEEEKGACQTSDPSLPWIFLLSLIPLGLRRR